LEFELWVTTAGPGANRSDCLVADLPNGSYRSNPDTSGGMEHVGIDHYHGERVGRLGRPDRLRDGAGRFIPQATVSTRQAAPVQCG
jgi:hypothetical protein